MQVDILSLQHLDRKFDIIECSGVLHHMEDPLAGWRILNDLLQPKGIMNIGLYSEYARQAIIEARSFIEKKGYKPTLEDIRKCRQAIFDLSEHNPWNFLLKKPDFFSASTVRDLIFHVQEHRFTLPEIAIILDELELEFLGFTIDQNIKKQYLACYPDDSHAISLENWNLFELENPHIFTCMYQFWVQKKVANV